VSRRLAQLGPLNGLAEKVPTGVTAGGRTKVGLSRADLQAIGRDNAIGLLPRLKV
jgi:hypothetical protein